MLDRKNTRLVNSYYVSHSFAHYDVAEAADLMCLREGQYLSTIARSDSLN